MTSVYITYHTASRGYISRIRVLVWFISCECLSISPFWIVNDFHGKMREFRHLQVVVCDFIPVRRSFLNHTSSIRKAVGQSKAKTEWSWLGEIKHYKKKQLFRGETDLADSARLHIKAKRERGNDVWQRWQTDIDLRVSEVSYTRLSQPTHQGSLLGVHKRPAGWGGSQRRDSLVFSTQVAWVTSVNTKWEAFSFFFLFDLRVHRVCLIKFSARRLWFIQLNLGNSLVEEIHCLGETQMASMATVLWLWKIYNERTDL